LGRGGRKGREWGRLRGKGRRKERKMKEGRWGRCCVKWASREGGVANCFERKKNDECVE
jgi:hypothetical protein